MKKLWIGCLSAILVFTCSFAASAFPGGYHHPKGHYNPAPKSGPNNGPKGNWQYNNPSPYEMKNNASYIIHRTAMVIFDAQRVAGHGYYNSGLGRAVAHQQMARDLYWRGAYRDAIFHSLRARDIAFQIINANRGRLSWDYSRDSMEDAYCQSAPRGEDLDNKLNFVMIGNDRDMVYLRLDIDLNF